MAYLNILITRTDANGIETEITDWDSVTVRKGLDQRANIVDVSLKNPLNRIPVGETQTYHRWVNDGGELIWQENDVITVKAAWNDRPTVLTDSNILTIADALEFKAKLEQQRSTLTISGADKTFALLNQTIPRAFTKADELTPGEIIQKIIQQATYNVEGNGTFSVTANLQVEATYTLQKASSTPGIQTRRINNSEFPIISIAKVYKPIYEWIDDLSTLEATNNFDGRDTSLPTDSQDNPVQNRKMKYFVDKNNNFRWFYPDNDVDYTIMIGSVTSIQDDIKNYSLTKTTFDVVNFVIYNGGQDLYGAGTLNYFFDKATTAKNLLNKYKAYNDIGIILAQQELNAGNLVSNTSGVFTYQGNRYNADTYGFTTSWGVITTGYTNDDYNQSFRDEIDRRCRQKALELVNRRSNPRWKGSITIKGRDFIAGELIELTSRVHGINGNKVRIQSLSHQFNRNGWTTTIEVEEDDEPIGTIQS